MESRAKSWEAENITLQTSRSKTRKAPQKARRSIEPTLLLLLLFPECLTCQNADSPTQADEPKNLWEEAYNLLDASQKEILATLKVPSGLNDNDASKTTDVIDQVIKKTETQYEAYKNGGLKIPTLKGEDINVRQLSEKVINAALKFKDIVTPFTALDPTEHASSAWETVLLGLTMMKNHYDSRNALFRSSEYLADTLSQIALIEMYFYCSGDSVAAKRQNIGEAITRVYKAILIYTVKVRNAQNSSKVRKAMEYVTAMTSESLKELQKSVNQEEHSLQQWINMVQNLQRRKEAKEMLNKIDRTFLGLKILLNDFILDKLNSLDAARFDSPAGEDSLLDDLQGTCQPGTRTELLAEVMDWATSPHVKPIFWLNGMAGTGKSTVSRTLSGLLEERGLLGASFFFKRNEGDRRNAKRLFPTIAKQLSHRIPRIIPEITEAVRGGVPQKTIERQCELPLQHPLLNLAQSYQTMESLVVVIDALDEYDSPRDIATFLRLISETAQNQLIPLRRPDLPKGLGFDEIENQDHQGVVLQDILEPIIKRDLSMFLTCQFENMGEKDWPATICRFVGDSLWLPRERLNDFLANPAITSDAGMNRTYLPILEQPLKKLSKNEKQKLMRESHDIIGVLILFATPVSLSALAQLTGARVNSVTNRLKSFRSVLSFSDDENQPVKALHLSFRDFLLSTDSEFHVDEKRLQKTIAINCLRIMESLRRNICDLSNMATEGADIWSKTIKQRIPPELQYSCRNLVYHVKSCQEENHREQDWEVSKILYSEILTFLQKHLLHWLEVLSLMGILRDALNIVDSLHSIFQSDTMPELGSFLLDVKRFIVRNFEGVEMAPLQIYVSSLLFSPHNSLVRKQFQDEIPASISRQPVVEKDWSPLLHTLASYFTFFVQFSPDGQLLATAPDPNTTLSVHLWNTTTWDLCKTLEHPRPSPVRFFRSIPCISCVAFSPQGNFLAVGSSEGLGVIWDTACWQKRHTRDYKESISSIALSCDGLLATASSNGIWVSDIALTNGRFSADVRTQGIDGNDLVRFSPNGKVLAMSDSEGVRIWRTETWSLVNKFNFTARTLNFSPKGTYLGIATPDTILFLDIASWKVVSTEELAPNSAIHEISFSRDEHHNAASSDSKDIRLGKVVQDGTSSPMDIQGHGGFTRAICFSPTQDILASSATDHKVKLWMTPPDIVTHSHHSSPHEDYVFYVAISPTGEHVASCSPGPRSLSGMLRLKACMLVGILEQMILITWAI
ncbi:uncharacterized protein N7483_006419 [Penicillium malachiteum]|uniref:uncharacterized protein n=1 Tax=Penicillium malachiteum TaxID=1324776 RepID=UPI002546CEAD|nr:uncharacterized protein N7483_006419 [Penicillium malachiteum]KAJ5725062.1 hypothetical protein N7483_006419 [Penicillium malachiteum]